MTQRSLGAKTRYQNGTVCIANIIANMFLYPSPFHHAGGRNDHTGFVVVLYFLAIPFVADIFQILKIEEGTVSVHKLLRLLIHVFTVFRIGVGSTNSQRT